jgi:DNA-binding CsgD family transcriptional regulator
MSDEAIGFYLDGLYRLDPLLRISRSGPRRGVYTLSQLRDREGENAYYDDIFRTALIYDELAILFPAPGRVCIALCLDRDSRKFTSREIRSIETLYPALESLHNAHLDRTFAAALSGGIRGPLGDSQQAVLIVDRHNQPVFRSERWKALERASLAPDLRMIHPNRISGMVSLDAGTVLHWEELGAGFAVAPRGRMCVIEQRSPGYVGADFKNALARFAQLHALTPQQRNIVELVLRGHPNSSIAGRLRISAGTVRNHRSRLYYKLDITTERELFSLFLQELFKTEDVAPQGDRRALQA